MTHYVIQVISDALSLITIASCLILKVPQIMTLHSMKSAGGMNLTGLGLELFSYTTMFMYNYCMEYSLLSYMEYPIILIQELVLIFFVLLYKNILFQQITIVYIIGYFCVALGFLSGLLPSSLLVFVVPFCTPISASSKIVFLYEILKSKNAQAVSLLTWFISAFTNATRIFTIYFDSADINLLANFTISTFLSSSIMAAAWFYKRTTNHTIMKPKAKEAGLTPIGGNGSDCWRRPGPTMGCSAIDDDDGSTKRRRMFNKVRDRMAILSQILYEYVSKAIYHVTNSIGF